MNRSRKASRSSASRASAGDQPDRELRVESVVRARRTLVAIASRSPRSEPVSGTGAVAPQAVQGVDDQFGLACPTAIDGRLAGPGPRRHRLDRQPVVADLGQELEGRLPQGDVTGGVEGSTGVVLGIGESWRCSWSVARHVGSALLGI